MTALTFGPRIQHYGGPCPVMPGTVVRVWNAFGDECDDPEPADPSWAWEHISAYAVASPLQPAAPAVEAWSPYNNTTPWGLLSQEQRNAMCNHAAYQVLSLSGRWEEKEAYGFNPGQTYRAVRKPEARQVVMHLRCVDGVWWADQGTVPHTHTFTLTLDAAGRPVSVGDLREKGAAG